MDKPDEDPEPAPKDWKQKGYLFSVEYKKRDDDARHFSNIRSALTTFLVTVGLGSGAGYFAKDHAGDPSFFWIVGIIFFAAAILTCLVFSWRTQCSDLQVRRLWKWATGAENADGSKKYEEYPVWKNYSALNGEEKKEIWYRIWADWMNRALALVIILVASAFAYSAIHPGIRSSDPRMCCDKRCCLGDNSPTTGVGSANSSTAAQAYAVAVSSNADAAKAYAEAAAIARDAAKTYAEAGKSEGAKCGCTITVQCDPSCPKHQSRRMDHH